MAPKTAIYSDSPPNSVKTIVSRVRHEFGGERAYRTEMSGDGTNIYRDK